MEQVIVKTTVREIPSRQDRSRTGLRILFLTSAHNSMSQRAYVELTRLGHEVSVGLATSERAMFEAVRRHSPDLIVAPMLKRAIPENIWREHVCIIMHPGPKGDRGPSSLDWAILEGHETWGVTLLQANAEMDAGDIWASHTFPMRPGASKSSIYKEEVIEAAESPADESWRNINAMDDLVHDIITMEDKLSISALGANAGAGGVALAAAADLVWARPNVVLNPHYKGMGGLYGSEYWTYLFPRRVGESKGLELTDDTLPLGAFAARKMGLVDVIFQGSPATFHDTVVVEAQALAHGQNCWMMLAMQEAIRRHDERRKPLAEYREEELARMRENFYGRDSSYHEARRRFVHKILNPPPTSSLAQGVRELAPGGRPTRDLRAS